MSTKQRLARAAWVGIALVACACGEEPSTATSGTDTIAGSDAPQADDLGAVAVADTHTALDTVPAADTGAAIDSGPPQPPDWLDECKADKDCAKYGDNNPCNGVLRCDKNVSPTRCLHKIGSTVTCPTKDDHACALNTCDPQTGSCYMKPQPKNVPCVDGDPCTLKAACDGKGSCKAATTSACGCKADKDCDVKTQANPCLGVWFCSKDSFPWRCVLNSSKAVKCPAAKNTPCKTNACDPKSGTCGLVNVLDGTPCDDGDKLTLGDTCKAGVCKPGIKPACKKHADCDVEEDGDLCNGVLFCDKGTGNCKVNPKTVIACKTVGDTACTKNTCDPATGACNAKAVKNGTACDDGVKCTSGDICLAGQCAGGVNTCACKKDADCAKEEDGNLCNGTLFCNLATQACQLQPKTIVTCPTVDDTDCVKSTCTPKTGKCAPKNVIDGKVCTDNNPCTAAGSCKTGKCVPGPKICLCSKDADCDKEDDGNKCNGTMFCDKSGSEPKCKLNPASVVKCATVLDTGCRKNLCNKLTGTCSLTNLADGLECDDKNPCTKNDACGGGVCKPGAAICECQSNADCATKEDGDKCNGTLYCDKSGKKPACKLNPASVVVCPAKSVGPCAFNGCDPVDGACKLQGKKDGTACSDGSVCTLGDACAKGQCAGKIRDCDDGNQCTSDTCNAIKGCQYSAANCNDANDCTLDLCDKKTGKCSFASQPREGKSCNADDDGCTVADTCKAGTCMAGSFALCQVKTGPCERATCVSTTATSFKCQVVSELDGTGCDDNKSCKVGAVCAKGSCQPGTADRLFFKTYGVASSGIHAHGVAEMDNGDLVLVGQWRPTALKGQSDSWWIRRVDLAGATLWTRYLSMKAASGPTANAVVAQPSGMAVVGLKATGKGQGGHGVVLRLSHAGTITSETAVGSDVEGFDPVDAIASADGGLVAVGSRHNGKGLVGHARKLSSQGTQRWARDVGAVGHGRLTGAVAVPTGGAWLVGKDGSASEAWGLVVLVDSFGKTKHTMKLDKTPAAAVAADASGALVVAASRRVGSVQRHETWRIGADRAVKWHRFVTSGDYRPAAIAFVGDRTVTAGTFGTLDKTGQFFTKSDAWLAARDSLGNDIWERVRDVGGVGHLADVIATKSGGLAAVGWIQPNKVNDRALLLRTDGWGHMTCAQSGDCLGKAPKDCADGNPCTVDGCTAKAGCTNLVSDDIACGDGDGCVEKRVCKASKCVPGGSERLKAVAVVGWSSIAQIGAAVDDGIVAANYRSPDNKTHFWSARRYDADLKPVWSWSRAPFPGQALIHAVVAATDGTVALAGNYSTGVSRAHVVLISKDGKTGKDIANIPSVSSIVEALPRTDGHFDMLAPKTLLKMSTGGAVLKQVGLGQTTGGMAATATGNLVIAGNGGALLVYNDSYTKLFGAKWNPPDGWVNAVYPQGNVLTVLADGTIVTDWIHWPKTANTLADRQHYLVGMSATGKTLWATPADNYQNPSQTRLDRRAVAMADGSFWAFAKTTTNVARPFMQRRDRLGNVMEERTIDLGVPSANAAHADIVSLANGDHVVALHATVKGKKTAMLARLSGFQYASCTAAGKCASQTTKSCDDGKPCTWDLCDPKKGCVHVIAAECNDGDPCTVDGCGPPKSGVGKWVCTHKAKHCNDNDTCTQDSCATVIVKGQKVGQCQHPKRFCDDNNDCTTDSCDKTKGCVFKARTGKAYCSDKNCTGRECQAGVCGYGINRGMCGSKDIFPARSCLQIKLKHASSKTGKYYVDPDGPDGPAPKLYVNCDMDTAGGGWTLVMALAGNTPHPWHMYSLPNGVQPAGLANGTGDHSGQSLAPRDFINKVVGSGNGEYLTCSNNGGGWIKFNKDGFDAFRGIWDTGYTKKALKELNLAHGACPPGVALSWKSAGDAMKSFSASCPGDGCYYIPGYANNKPFTDHWVHRHKASPAAGNGKTSRVWVR